MEHLAGRTPTGELLVFWSSPRTRNWQVVSASREAGAQVAGPVTAWVTQAGEFTVEHLAGRGPTGDLLVFWWSRRVGRWQVVNASRIAAGPACDWLRLVGATALGRIRDRALQVSAGLQLDRASWELGYRVS